MRPRSVPALLALVALSGCDDPTGSGTVGTRDASPSPAPDVAPLVDAAPPPPRDAAFTPPPVDATRPPPPPPKDAALPPVDAAPPGVNWVEVELAPRQPLYALDDAVTARATAFDRAGDPLPDVVFTWRVEPPGLANIDAEGALTLTGEGQGTVVACAGDGPCGRTALFIDAGPPTLVVTTPAQAAILGGDASRTLSVTGTATDSRGPVSVSINGVRAFVDDDGAFALDVPARFGINRVEVTADDGVRRPPQRVVRDVLWAPRYLRVQDGGALIERAAVLRVDQVVLDHDAPVEIPAGAAHLEAAHLEIDELAQLIGLLVGLADPGSLLANPVIADTAALRLRVEAIRLGPAEVGLTHIGGGMELFLRLPRIELDTTGALQLEGESVSLDGTLQVGVAAVSVLHISGGATLQIEAGQAGVALESVEGRFADPTVTAVLDSIDSRLRGVVESLVADLAVGLVVDQLPVLVQQGLGAFVSILADLPIRLDLGLADAEPVTLRLSMQPTAVEVRRRETLQILLDARLTGVGDGPARREDDPGVPAQEEEPFEWAPDTGVVLAVQLALLNGLLHEVWRAGVLDFAPPLPPDLAGLLADVRMEAHLPPVVAPAPAGSAFPLEAQIGDLLISARGPRNEAPDLYSLSARVGLTVRLIDGRFQIVVDEDPDIRAVLVSFAGDRPVLSANGLALLVEAVVWPQVTATLDRGLLLSLQETAIDAAQLQGFAPRLRGLTIAPDLLGEPTVAGDWIVLEGGLRMGLDVAAP